MFGVAYPLESKRWITTRLAEIGSDPTSRRSAAGLAEVVRLIFQLDAPEEFAEGISTFMKYKGSPIRRTAASFFRRLGKAETRVKQSALVEWIDGDGVVCRFQHPRPEYGSVEREFSLLELRVRLLGTERPPGAPDLEEGDSFTLEMELDEDGHVISYLPVPRTLKKGDGGRDEFDDLPFPENIDDEEAMAEYERKWQALAAESIRKARSSHDRKP